MIPMCPRSQASTRLPMILALTVTLLAAARRPAAAQCLGDCNGDGATTMVELMTGVGLALDPSARGECPAFGAASVTISTLVGAIQGATTQCRATLCRADDSGVFDDHSERCVASNAQLFSLAARDQNRAAVKFVITEFRSPQRRAMRYMDSSFYDLHDEWYWFRLLNGQAVAGDSVAPVGGLRFDSIEEIYAWARRQTGLPLDLRLFDGRLGSQRFYRLALEDPRTYGIGTLLYIAARQDPPTAERWLFQLEYSDTPGYAQLRTFFEMLDATLPSGLRGQVDWLVRSPAQDSLAHAIEVQRLPYFERIARYSDLVVPGQVEVYSEGIAAGRLSFLTLADGSLDQAAPGDIVVIDQVPDTLPNVAALVTAVPQVPLAHVSLLSRSRAAPDAYVEGILRDPSLRQLAEQHALMAIRTRQPDGFDLARISESEYTTWLGLTRQTPIAVSQIDLPSAPYVVDLAGSDPSHVDGLRPLIGGKASGELFLMAAENVTSPDLPLAITIRAYSEHIVALRPAIVAMLSDSMFVGAAPIRFLVLEGGSDYDARYRTAADLMRKEEFLMAHPAGDLVGDLVRGGGLKKVLQAMPIAASTYATIRSALEARFHDFAVTQGIRFRSSSTVEDIEGFTGAGLYSSNTGFLDAAAQENSADRKKTVEVAINKTWASYWGFEAFEERQQAGIDHLSGNMGLLVHARADDAKELANGVLTFTRYPRSGTSIADRAVLDVNVQVGATSVTNPEPGSGTAEFDRLSRNGVAGPIAISRLRASSLVEEGEVVFDDSQLAALFAQAESVADLWLAQKNSSLPTAQKWRSVVLDFETRWMAAGWPALIPDLPAHSARLLLKQVRSLDPGLRGFPAAVLQLPVPRDILARTRRIERHTCRTSWFEATVVESYTDSLLAPDLGYGTVPFVSPVGLTYLQDVPTLGQRAGDHVTLNHLALSEVSHTGASGDAWGVSIAADGANLVLSELELQQTGKYRISAGGSSIGGSDAQCEVEVLRTTASDYLGQILDGRR